MLTLKRTARRGIAVGVAGLLVAGTAAVLSAPAQAADTVDVDTIGGAFKWTISEQVVTRYGTRVVDGGAFETDNEGEIAFPIESASVADGAVTVEYGGSLDSQFVMSGSVLYSTLIEDPTVTINADGSGELSAVVSGFQHFEPAYPLQQTTPTRVVIGEFEASTGDLDSTLEATIGGFSTDFVNQLADGTKPHFNASSEAKNPAAFTLAQPSLTAEVLDGDRVAVTGADFFGGDAKYNGVYVGLAPAGGQPDTSSMGGMEAYAGKDWVTTSRISDGAFTSEFPIDFTKVEAGVEYSVYAWQAHAHTTHALDTELPVGVLKEKAAPAKKIKTTTKITKTKHAKKAAKFKQIRVRAKVGNPAKGKTKGKVQIIIKKGKKNVRVVKGVKLNKNGKINRVVKGLGKKVNKKGQYRVVVKYMGTKKYAKSKAVKKFRLK